MGTWGIWNSYPQTTHMWWLIENQVHKNLVLIKTLFRKMSNSQCRKLSTNLRLEAGLLIINTNFQKKGDISIKTCFIYAKNYPRKMFYFYAFWGVIKKKHEQWLQCDCERLFFLRLTPLPSQLTVTSVDKSSIIFSFWIMFYNCHLGAIYITSRPDFRTGSFLLSL